MAKPYTPSLPYLGTAPRPKSVRETVRLPAPSPALFGITEQQQAVLEALGAFGVLRLSELANAIAPADERDREEAITQRTIDALAQEYPAQAHSMGVDLGQVRVAAQFNKLKKPPTTDADALLVDISTGLPAKFADTAVPAGHWRSARIAAIDVTDSARVKRAGYHLRLCLDRGFVATFTHPKTGRYYGLTRKGAAALNRHAPCPHPSQKWAESSITRVSAVTHLAAATGYLLFRKSQGAPVWSEFALHGAETTPTMGHHPLLVSGQDFTIRFARRPDGLVRMEDGTLEVIEVENAEKDIRTFVSAISVLSTHPTTPISRERISRLTFVVPDSRFDMRIYKAALLFFGGQDPDPRLPRFEGKAAMPGTDAEKFSAFCSRIHIHELAMTPHRSVPFLVRRETTLAEMLAALKPKE